LAADTGISKLDFGDNLVILREHVPNDSVDLFFPLLTAPCRAILPSWRIALPPLSPDTQRLVLRLFRLHSGLTIMEQAVLRSRLASRPVCMNDDEPPTLLEKTGPTAFAAQCIPARRREAVVHRLNDFLGTGEDKQQHD
jgi:hypothetical protein